MAGKMIAELRTACLANQGKSPKPANKGQISINVKGENGHAFVAYINSKNLTETETPKTDFAGLASTSPDIHSNLKEVEWQGWMAIEEEPQTRIDWNEHSQTIDEMTFTTISPLQQKKHTPICTESHPFYVDSGATIHISPEQSDFQTLRAIPA